MKKQLPAWAALCIISLIAGLLLALTNALTAERIAEQGEQAANAARFQAAPEAEAFDALDLPEKSALDNVYAASKGGLAVGYVSQITVKGYGGPIEVVAGMDLNGALTGVVVGGSAFAETAGLGAKTKDLAFTTQFKNKQTPLVLKQDIDSVAGASISSGAVVSGVNKMADYMKTLLPGYVPEDEGATGAVETRAVTVNGFMGEVEVTVGLAADGTIANLEIGGANFQETAGLGERVTEKAFRDQFIGKSGALSYGDGIDAISGATVTSNAVMAAVNEALAQGPVTGPTLVTETAKGFMGEVEVTVGIAADGSIASLEIGGANFQETASLGERVTEKAFRDQFIGKSGTLAYGDGIDAISGATVTSNAVMEAVNKALGVIPVVAFVDTDDSEPAEPTAEPMPEPTAEPTPEPTSELVPMPEVQHGAEMTEKSETVTVKGFMGDIDVTVTLADDGTIAGVEVGGANFQETPGLGEKAKDAAFTDQFIGKSGVLAYGDGIDAIAGATVTSNAVLDAINQVTAAGSAAPAKGETKTVTVKGFMGDIDVTVTLAADGTIAGVEVGGANFQETPGLGEKAKDAAFTDQFIGKSSVLAYGDGIDAIAGATVTSNAVLDAINQVTGTNDAA